MDSKKKAHRPMTLPRALKLALRCIDEQVQHLAVDANFADMFGADYPHALVASEARRQLLEARDLIGQEMERLKAEGSQK